MRSQVDRHLQYIHTVFPITPVFTSSSHLLTWGLISNESTVIRPQTSPTTDENTEWRFVWAVDGPLLNHRRSEACKPKVAPVANVTVQNRDAPVPSPDHIRFPASWDSR